MEFCCEDIAAQCFKLIKKQIDKDRKANFIYRHGSLCIAYLLRRRRFDPTYMDPEKEFACRVKSFLNKTIEDMKPNGPIDVMSGFVDLSRVTEIIIEYIDRKGRGRLILD